MDDRAEATREFCRAVPLAGGATTIPRWTLDPAPGVVVHVATLHDHLVAAVRRLADGLQLPLHSVALAAHAKVLAAPSGEHDVVTGYVAGPGGRPMPCRLVPADVHGSVGLPLAGQPSTDREERDEQECAHHAFRGGRRGRRGAAHARRAATCGRRAQVPGLGENRIGRCDDFFDVGGTSLSAGNLAIVLTERSLPGVRRPPGARGQG